MRRNIERNINKLRHAEDATERSKEKRTAALNKEDKKHSKRTSTSEINGVDIKVMESFCLVELIIHSKESSTQETRNEPAEQDKND